jgi:hypothetical protein
VHKSKGNIIVEKLSIIDGISQGSRQLTMRNLEAGNLSQG